MFVITNRVLNPGLKNPDACSMQSIPADPAEFRFAKVRKVSPGYEVEIPEIQLSWFKGAPVNRNAQLKKTFTRIFQGENAERQFI